LISAVVGGARSTSCASGRSATQPIGASAAREPQSAARRRVERPAARELRVESLEAQRTPSCAA
jgi:hypothetical protein